MPRIIAVQEGNVRAFRLEDACVPGRAGATIILFNIDNLLQVRVQLPFNLLSFRRSIVNYDDFVGRKPLSENRLQRLSNILRTAINRNYYAYIRHTVTT